MDVQPKVTMKPQPCDTNAFTKRFTGMHQNQLNMEIIKKGEILDFLDLPIA